MSNHVCDGAHGPCPHCAKELERERSVPSQPMRPSKQNPSDEKYENRKAKMTADFAMLDTLPPRPWNVETIRGWVENDVVCHSEIARECFRTLLAKIDALENPACICGKPAKFKNGWCGGMCVGPVPADADMVAATCQALIRGDRLEVEIASLETRLADTQAQYRTACNFPLNAAIERRDAAEKDAERLRGALTESYLFEVKNDHGESDGWMCRGCEAGKLPESGSALMPNRRNFPHCDECALGRIE